MPPWLLRFGPYIALALLVGVVLWQRAHIAEQAGDLKVERAKVADMTEANKTLSQTIDMVTRQRVDNDAIAAAVTAALQGNTQREVQTKTIIERAVQNDPAVRDWGGVPVPSSVREALRSGQVDPGPR